MLKEEKVEREMERQQVIVADRKMAELVRLVIRVKNGEEVRQVEGMVQEDGGVGKVGGSSEEWGGSEAGGGTGAGGTERSNGRTKEGDESGRLSKA
ncbi:hypothetical protein GH714_014015 [Hevea brasiliensis]|uniref:Uncharacterized protein n=1 Tax=Hevea brasiliensis TaxID=3981 RepID=A0A6A6LS97_HEVBR|nr:hypothetical protein GH714_014015 [Hevea brasiliensis]